MVSLGGGITCLIDTGADTPVWTQGGETLMDTFKAQKIPDKVFLLSGFGKQPEVVDAYNISDLTISDGNGNHIVFRNLTVACTERPNMVAFLIMPATALTHTNYTVRNIDIEKPVIEIEYKKEEFYVNPIYNPDSKQYIERVYSFTSESTGV